MILVTCVECGVVFDLEIANECDNEKEHNGSERCFVCPLGHVGHDSQAWWAATRRKATSRERKLGIKFMLPEFEVKLSRDASRGGE